MAAPHARYGDMIAPADIFKSGLMRSTTMKTGKETPLHEINITPRNRHDPGACVRVRARGPAAIEMMMMLMLIDLFRQEAN